ncbi:thiamine kinase [Erwinia sp. JUb26]|uniref:thiamine kinase n=1 Tax=Erwinia sp. JUb26 TaxID=2485126 RepID=UPI000F467D45|nr:thiamine kinase [Erwinia sp. JUb26]ROR11395.1 thiamine kinase [Erwinia sp. JUb26]
MTFSINGDLRQLITRQFPAAQAAGTVLPLDGLSGYSMKVSLPNQTLLARRAAGALQMPGVDRQREYRILRKLHASGLVPAVYGRSRHWLLLDWLPGEMLSAEEFGRALEPLSELIAALHRQPLSGYRLQLMPLLMDYWQRSHPSRRTLTWLRALKRLRRRGEPPPLRLAVLHMDIHCGNLIGDGGRLRLIDWEYAGDGDVALELAALIDINGLNDAQQQRLIDAFAARQNLDSGRLFRQIRRWQPWLLLLATSWYELRWQQTGENHFGTLAATGWQRLSQLN